MDAPNTISSDYIVDDIEIPFKVVAGPGAGKTYWLANHVKNVIKTSTRLTPVSLVACITYTNVGTEELLSELEDTSDRVWVSTIHSFLYTNIVKPYIWLLKNEDGTPVVNYQEMDGHYDSTPSDGKIEKWKRVTKSNYVIKKHARKCLARTVWNFEDGNLQLTVKPECWRHGKRYSIKKENLYTYKELCWQDGIIHHDDVLYFSYLLLTRYPFILEFLSAKFPYVFLDEFQDTSPIQTEIVKMLFSVGSCIGVIGDPAQSIFEFIGASRADFMNFNLLDMNIYHMETNRRSTNQIIRTLNAIRESDDLVQEPFRSVDGVHPVAYVAPDIITAVKHFKKEVVAVKGDYCIVTRRNSTVTKLRKCDMTSSETDTWDYLQEHLSYRAAFLKQLLIAREYALQGRYELAVKDLMRIFRPRTNGYLGEPFTDRMPAMNSITKRGLCVKIVESLISQQNDYWDDHLLNFYNYIADIIASSCGRKLRKVTRGNPLLIMGEYIVSAVADEIILSEAKMDTIRTIHKSKGAQFNSVLVVFEEEKELEYLIAPSLDSEDSRLYYVALSRAKDFLSIAVPSIQEEAKIKLEDMGFNIIECK